jgi:hypothetical protein
VIILYQIPSDRGAAFTYEAANKPTGKECHPEMQAANSSARQFLYLLWLAICVK